MGKEGSKEGRMDEIEGKEERESNSHKITQCTLDDRKFR